MVATPCCSHVLYCDMFVFLNALRASICGIGASGAARVAAVCYVSTAAAYRCLVCVVWFGRCGVTQGQTCPRDK
jgi:hypothetical protein